MTRPAPKGRKPRRIRLTDTDWDAAVAAAEAEGTSASAWVEKAIRTVLAEGTRA